MLKFDCHSTVGILAKYSSRRTALRNLDCKAVVMAWDGFRSKLSHNKVVLKTCMIALAPSGDYYERIGSIAPHHVISIPERGPRVETYTEALEQIARERQTFRIG